MADYITKYGPVVIAAVGLAVAIASKNPVLITGAVSALATALGHLNTAGQTQAVKALLAQKARPSALPFRPMTNYEK